MLCFNIRWHHQIPEIDKGSGDLESPSTTGEPALHNAAGHAPSLTTLGVIYAEDYVGQGGWNVAEYMVVFPPSGQNPPPLASDQRHPGDLQTSGFPNADQGVETRDLYSNTGATIGCAFRHACEEATHYTDVPWTV